MAAPEELKTLFVKSLNARFTEKLLEVRLFCVYYFCIIIFLFKFEILNIFEFEKLNFIKYYYIGSIFKSLGFWGFGGKVRSQVGGGQWLLHEVPDATRMGPSRSAPALARRSA